LGWLVKSVGFPAPVVMPFPGVAAKLTNAVPRKLQEDVVVYQFFRTAVTYPWLLPSGGHDPWDKLIAAFARKPPHDFSDGRDPPWRGVLCRPRINLYPIEAADRERCHSGQGGTGTSRSSPRPTGCR